MAAAEARKNVTPDSPPAWAQKIAAARDERTDLWICDQFEYHNFVVFLVLKGIEGQLSKSQVL